MPAIGRSTVHLSPRRAVLAIVIVATTGCTVLDEKRKLDADQVRVHDKETALSSEQRRGASLEAEKQGLMRDLSDRRVTLEQLDGRLAQLQAQNANSVGTTKAQQDRNDRLASAIAARRAEIKVLGNRTDLLDAEKLRRIDALKQQIGQQLEFQLH